MRLAGQKTGEQGAAEGVAGAGGIHGGEVKAGMRCRPAGVPT